MYSCTIKRKSYSKRIINSIEKALPTTMETVMKHAKEIALKNKRGSKDENSILFELNVTNFGIEGKLYTNFDYAMFLEYGTGTEAELPHIGHTETFLKSGFKYWFLPKSIADEKGKEFAPQRLINIEGELFYIMFATKPYPFMRPTAFELEDSAVKIFASAMAKELR